MTFLCQKTPTLKKFKTKVVSCKRTEEGRGNFPGTHIVELEESLFFPEGGGQPADLGTIGSANVLWVSRGEGRIFHHLDGELAPQSEVECVLDWPRRYDHMQQHSGQHLVSAILDARGIPTVSWELGRQVCNVEVKADSGRLNMEFLAEIEKEINEKIRQNLPLILHECSPEDLKSLVTRGDIKRLPPETAALGRVVTVIEIKGLDFNMCCGTHVSSLAEVQMVKLLHAETTRGNVKLFFICGERVLNKLSLCYSTEKQISKLLGCQPLEQSSRIEAIKRHEKALEKSRIMLLKQLALYDAVNQAEALNDNSKEDYDSNYLTTLMKQLSIELEQRNRTDVIVMGVCGTIKDGGNFCVRAPDSFLTDNQSRILELLGAKGKARNGTLQGKSNCFSKLYALVKELDVISKP